MTTDAGAARASARAEVENVYDLFAGPLNCHWTFLSAKGTSLLLGVKADERSQMLKVKSMELGELIKAKATIEAEIELRAASERADLIKAIQGLRKISGSRAEKSETHALKGRKLPPLYRNPKNRAETWAGRGNRPRWLVAALKQGKKLEALAIK